MDEQSVRQMLVAKYYLALAAEQSRMESDAAQFAAINLLHEALETTLVTCAGHLNAAVADRSSIELYLDRINEKLSGTELPFRTRVLRFNKARVLAKHHATLPDRSVLSAFNITIPEFIHATAKVVFGVDIDEISLVDLLEDKETVQLLREAHSLLRENKYYECLVACRKAFILTSKSLTT